MKAKHKALLFIIPLIIVLIAIPLINTNSSVSTTTFIKVIEKEHSQDFKENWLIASPPNDSISLQEEMKIMIEDPMVWNLIEENETYFVNFIKKGDKTRVLNHIENIGDQNAIQ